MFHRINNCNTSSTSIPHFIQCVSFPYENVTLHFQVATSVIFRIQVSLGCLSNTRHGDSGDREIIVLFQSLQSLRCYCSLNFSKPWQHSRQLRKTQWWRLGSLDHHTTPALVIWLSWIPLLLVSCLGQTGLVIVEREEARIFKSPFI